MLSTKEKGKLIEQFRANDKDTGSPEVQIALLSEEIRQLAAHLKKHPKDNHSRRGLLSMVVRRKKLGEYLRATKPKRYSKVAKALGLKS